jgi:hypothetical protein
MTPNNHLATREAWLLNAADQMRHVLFKGIGETLPAVKVSVGFPGGGSARKRVGEHWHPKATKDGVSQVFISPVVDDGVKALGILAHELIHAIYPDDGHGPKFGRVARAIGMTGPLTATEAGEELTKRLNVLASRLGDYPHAGLDMGNRKKQSTRLIALRCARCDYRVWTTQRWLSTGSPDCPSKHDEMISKQV